MTNPAMLLLGVVSLCVFPPGAGVGLAGEGRADATRERQPPAKADYDRHLSQLRAKVGNERFAFVVQPPFVVIGDESRETVQRRAEHTVKWAVDKLKEAYFPKDPTEILDVWLFKDRTSYEAHCKSIFGQAPTSPYGFFSHADRALVMNIATGGGTLVHEIVHAYMAANFPDCPAWFNEGLASLYEQSSERDGQIVGLTNWRLDGLQKAVQKKRVPSLEKLCGTTAKQFYDEDRGTNYAQARYLCYYLQERGLLRKFYREFHERREQDPSGCATLKAVLGRNDMAAFQKEWEGFVLKLRFP